MLTFFPPSDPMGWLCVSLGGRRGGRLCRGADANLPDRKTGATALMVLDLNDVKHIEGTKLLLSFGADPAAAANDGSTPISVAERRGNGKSAVLLADVSLNPPKKTPADTGPCLCPAQHSHPYAPTRATPLRACVISPLASLVPPSSPLLGVEVGGACTVIGHDE